MNKDMELPPNFQEQMMNCELEFQNELNEANIRKLIYVYTLGMQYYNLKDKEDFENYYRGKLNNLLLNESVINYLDTHQVDLSKKVDLNLFPENNDTNKNKINKNEKSNKKSSFKKNVAYHDDTEIKTGPSLDLFKKKSKIKKQDIIDYVTRKIKEVDIKLKSIDKEVSNNIVEQMSAFESNKRNKKVKKSKIPKEKEEKNEQNINKIIRKESTSSDNGEIDIDIDLNNIPKRTTRRRGSSIGQTKLLKEIEEYVEKNMKEMYNAIEELKKSYEDEINEAVESGFDEIAESLRNDLKFEEENLTAQYEEERMKQIELIREKHKKK
jgi:hypothetical protein